MFPKTYDILEESFIGMQINDSKHHQMYLYMKVNVEDNSLL